MGDKGYDYNGSWGNRRKHKKQDVFRGKFKTS